MEKIYQDENLLKFRACLRSYGDELRTGVIQKDKEAVRKHHERVKNIIDNIVDLLLISSKTQNREVLKKAFMLSFDYCETYAPDGSLDYFAIIELVCDYEEFYKYLLDKSVVV